MSGTGRVVVYDPDGVNPYGRELAAQLSAAGYDVTTVVAEPGMPSIDDNPNERIGEPGSDHAAVIATFDF